MTTTKTKTKTTYDGTAKSAFGSGNVEGQSSVEVLMTLFVLESVDLMPAKSYASESSEEEEEEESSSSSGGRERGCDVGVFFFIIFFFFTAGRTVERFSIVVLLPTIACVFSSEGERCFGRLRVRAKDDAESIDVSQSRRRKKDSKKTKRENEDDTSWFNLYRSIMLLRRVQSYSPSISRKRRKIREKMKEYGVSVMDVGVGSFVFSASCVKWRE